MKVVASHFLLNENFISIMELVFLNSLFQFSFILKLCIIDYYECSTYNNIMFFQAVVFLLTYYCSGTNKLYSSKVDLKCNS